MPVDDAVLDSPVLDAGSDVQETPETPVEAIESVEAPETPAVEVKGDERVMPQWMKNLKATDPVAFREAKGIFFNGRNLKEKIGDLNLDEVLPFLGERGGVAGIQQQFDELTSKSEELDGLYDAINSGDTSVIDKVPDEALQPIALAAFDKFAQTQPEAWQAYQSNIFANTINQAGIVPFLDKMAMMVQYNDTQNLPVLLGQLKDWAQSFSQAGQQGQSMRAVPGQAAKPKETVEQARQKWEAERAQETYSNDVASKAQSARNDEIGKQLAGFVDRRKGDEEAKNAAYEMLNTRVNDRMMKDAGLQKQLASLAAKRDVQGALRLIASREGAVIREEAPKVGRMIFGQPTATPAPTAAPAKARTEERTTPVSNTKASFLDSVFAR